MARFEQLLVGPVRNGIYKPKEFHGQGAKIVNMGEIFKYPRLHAVPMQRVELTTRESSTCSVAIGDLLFARRSLVAEGAGKCCVVTDVDELTTFESSLIRARPDVTRSNPLYLYYFFCSPIGLHKLDTIRRHVAVAGITGGDLAQLEIPVPPLSEQRAIARVLGALDDRIELNLRMNSTLEAMARALFQSWFVDFDPVQAKMEGRDTGLPREISDTFPDRFVDSDSGRVPDGWKVSEIGQEVLALGGTTPSTKRSDYWDGGKHFWATPKDLSRLSSPVLLGTDRTITDAGLARISSGLLPVGTVLLSSRAPVGYLAVAEVPTAVNQGFIAMICNKRLSNLYVLFWCSERVEYIQGISGGSTFAEISKKVFRPIPVTVPSEQVLGAFERLVRPLYARIVANMKQSILLSQVRDVLLPQLVSGAVRLPSVLVDHHVGSDLQVAS